MWQKDSLTLFEFVDGRKLIHPSDNVNINHRIETVEDVQERVQPPSNKSPSELALEAAAFLEAVYGGPSTLCPYILRAPTTMVREHIDSVDAIVRNVQNAKSNGMEKK